MHVEDHPFIQSLTAAERKDILGHIESISLSHGEVMCFSPEEAEVLYLVADGTLSFFSGKAKSGVPVRELTEGSSFYSGGLLGESYGDLVAIAKSDCSFVSIPFKQLLNCISDSPTELTDIAVCEDNMRPIIPGVQINGWGSDLSTNDEVLVQTLRSDCIDYTLNSLKSTLWNIQLAHDILRSGKDTSKTEHVYSIIDRQLSTFDALTQDLFSCVSLAGNPCFETLALGPFVSDFAETMADELVQRKIELVTQMNELSVCVDRRQLQQLLHHLVKNALLALDSFREDGRIEIDAFAEERSVVITVRDNGPGIPECIRNILYKPFVSYGREVRSGLGLASVRSIVEAHGAGMSIITGQAGTFCAVRFRQDPSEASAH